MRRTRVVLALSALPLLLASQCPPSLPALLTSQPSAGATIAVTEWIRLRFAGPVSPDALWRVLLACEGTVIAATPHLLDETTVVLQPVPELPASKECEIGLGTTEGTRTIAFRTSAPGTSFTPLYDRTDPERPLPFPDDVFLVPDPTKPSGRRLELVLPSPPGTAIDLVTRIAERASATADGWSPIGSVSVQLSAPPEPSSLPSGRDASLDPLSSIALIDLTPGSPQRGRRIPFDLVSRSDSFPGSPVSHNLLLWPGIPLEPLGTYGMVITDRVQRSGGGPLRRSPFFQDVVGPARPGEAPEVAATRPLAEEVLQAAESLAPVPIPRGDVVLAVRFSIRSTAHFANDLLAMRAVVSATPPNVQVTSVAPSFGNIVEVRGTFDAPAWVTSVPFVARGLDGLPIATGIRSIPFVLTLPRSNAQGRAPLVLYQHGSPGSAPAEVPYAGSRVADAGFAVAGFTDSVNSRLATLELQQFVLFFTVNQVGELPDYYIETYADQMAFVKALQSLGDLDVLPLGAPDGVPDLDPTRIVYEGISYGSTHGQALLAYAPEIRAAALVAGASRFIELLEYQDRTLPLGGAPLIRSILPANVTGLRPTDVWLGLSLLAVTYDRQDPHNHARFLFRDPLPVDGTTRKASVLVVEGINDRFTKNAATRSLAWQLGPVPQLAPAVVRVPDLPLASGPIAGNVDADTTAALVQYAPLGAGVPPSTGCGFEGHFCAQTAEDALRQRLDFYRSALEGTPVIE